MQIAVRFPGQVSKASRILNVSGFIVPVQFPNTIYNNFYGEKAFQGPSQTPGTSKVLASLAYMEGIYLCYQMCDAAGKCEITVLNL